MEIVIDVTSSIPKDRHPDLTEAIGCNGKSLILSYHIHWHPSYLLLCHSSLGKSERQCQVYASWKVGGLPETHS